MLWRRSFSSFKASHQIPGNTPTSSTLSNTLSPFVLFTQSKPSNPWRHIIINIKQGIRMRMVMVRQLLFLVRSVICVLIRGYGSQVMTPPYHFFFPVCLQLCSHQSEFVVLFPCQQVNMKLTGILYSFTPYKCVERYFKLLLVILLLFSRENATMLFLLSLTQWWPAALNNSCTSAFISRVQLTDQQVKPYRTKSNTAI